MAFLFISNEWKYQQLIFKINCWHFCYYPKNYLGGSILSKRLFIPPSACRIDLSVFPWAFICSPWNFCSTWSSLICSPCFSTVWVSLLICSPWRSTTWTNWLICSPCFSTVWVNLLICSPWAAKVVSIFVSRWLFEFLYSLNSLRVTYSVFTGITGLLSLNCLLNLP
ncbi:hypothetical protein MPNC_4650 [Mycoplasmoides pneumoniae]|nr:hypothetical protein MPNA4650 [Mycoplasmoides pneumoniae 309]BAV20702.1 hypothetical protein MPNC_4650 [Mycoplasmoides pneumoniae]